MKKLLAGVLTLSLALAACSNGSDDDSSKKDDSSKDKQSSEDKSKDSKNNDKKSNDSSDKDKNSDSKSNDSNSDGSDNASNNDGSDSSNSDANSGNTNGSNDSSNSNGSSNGNDSTTSSNNGNASGSENTGNNDNATSNTSSNGNAGASQYVAPYQGQNAVPVAQNITAGGTDAQSALQYLPNFQTALDNATAEVNSLNGQTNPYNDYAIEGSSGSYTYIFSFQNQAQPGTYMIATVDQQGTVRVVDPAYQQ
ncbi:hypothetical protein [Staphylococcus caeli]|uniref:hypothetical protein n=1 Tax=Staphylococcus caeli TaxID=2201815 RepID=UPI003F57FE13